MLGKNGGAAFILIYVIMLVVLCLPVMVSEYLIGRRGGSNPFSSFDKLAPGSKWRWIGFLAVLASACILSFYCLLSLMILCDYVRFHLMLSGRPRQAPPRGGHEKGKPVPYYRFLTEIIQKVYKKRSCV